MDKRVDEGHRPWADHKGEKPQTYTQIGPWGINVTLDAWGPEKNVFETIYRQLQSNWGEKPEEVGEDGLSEKQLALVENCIAGKTIQNPLEAVNLMFTIEGISRACTHQIVRTRLGASFMQHGGRDNDWRHRNWSMPESIWRACEEWENGGIEKDSVGGFISPINDWEPISSYFKEKESSFSNGSNGHDSLLEEIESHIQRGKDLYSALVDAGIPYQDARHLLPIGTVTYIHANYNYLALRGLLANRLEYVNDWEINCVAQLMVREVRMKMPALFGKYLMSHSDRAGKAAFANLDSWPPDQKYPHKWKQSERKFRPEQNPFFVLTEDSINGGPFIEWIKTNGTYPGSERGEVI